MYLWIFVLCDLSSSRLVVEQLLFSVSPAWIIRWLFGFGQGNQYIESLNLEKMVFWYKFIFSERFESSDATKIFWIWSLVLIFVFLWCTEIESGLLLIFVVLTIVKIPIVVFQFDRVHFSWNFIVRLVVTVSRLCRGHLCWSMLLAMFWSHYDPILWSKYSILALFWLFLNIPVWW